MTEPTQEQIKEFWEWCEVEKILQAEYSPLDEVIRQPHYEYPPIDLNNLFKYAIPLLEWYSIHVVEDGTGNKLINAAAQLKAGDKPKFSIDKDPADALFWAIYEVIKGVR